MKFTDWLLVFTLSALWGTSFFFVELALPSFAPLTLAFTRIAMAAALLIILLKWRGTALAGILARWRTYAVLGFFNPALPFALLAWGQQHIDSALASVLNALTPVFAFIISTAIGRDTLDARRSTGLALSFIGVIILVNPEVKTLEALGILAGTVAAFSYGIGLNIAVAPARRYPPYENACGQLTFATLALLPFALWEQPWQATYTTSALVAISALGIFGTLFAYLVLFRLVSTVGMVNTSLAIFFVPVIAVSLGAYGLDEPITPAFLFGMALILTGMALTDRNTQQALKKLLRLHRQ